MNINEILNLIPKPLVIVTVGENNRVAGMVASWYSQVSYEPPLIGVAIYNKWYTLELIKEFNCFALHLVTKDILEPAIEIFGKLSSRQINKFEATERRYGLTIEKSRKVRAPIIKDSPLIIECEVQEYVNIGDHVFVIGKPVEIHINRDKLRVENIVVFYGNAFLTLVKP